MSYAKNLIKYLEIINNILEDSELDNLDILFDTLNRHFENKGRVFLAGNGGSAAIASHASTDLKKLRKEIDNELPKPFTSLFDFYRKVLPAVIALATDQNKYYKVKLNN